MKNRYIIIMSFALFFMNEAQAQDNTFYMDDNSLVTIQSGAILHVEGDLHMDAASDLDNAGTINLQGDWRFEAATADITSAGTADEQGLINFENNFSGNAHNTGAIQRIYAPADMLGNAAFYDVNLRNDQGIIELDGGAIEIRNTMDFNVESQILRTDAGVTTGDGEGDYAHWLQVSNTSPSALVGVATASGATNGYIQGRLQWMTTSGNTYSFPVGVASKNTQLFEITPTNSADALIQGAFTADAGGVLNLTDCGATIDCAINHGWWNIDEYGTSNVTSYAVNLKAANVVDDCAGVDFAVIKKASGASVSTYALEGNDGFTSATSCDNIATTTANVGRHNLTSFSDFTIGATATTVLPVELLSFSGEAEKRKNRLFWETASEENVSHFEIEKSRDGLDFEYIGRVSAIGNSSSVVSYEYLDLKLESIIYYRLKMMDLDGSYEYSNVIVIRRIQEGFVSSLYPNPTNGFVMIESMARPSSPIKIKVFNSIGQELDEREGFTDNEGSFSLDMDFSLFPSGTYIIKLLNEDIYDSLILTKK